MTFDVPKSKEVFTVNNYEGAYSGITTLARGDHVLRQLGLRAGRHQGRDAQDRPAGRAHGHPHERLDELGDDARRPQGGRDAARHGARVRDLRERRRPRLRLAEPGPENPRDERAPGPVGIRRIEHEDDGKWTAITLPDGERAINRKRTRNVLEKDVAEQVGSLLQNVVKVGTGTRAQVGSLPISGKTGTTEGYGDAWFVGWTPEYTIAVWVGYPNEFRSMETEFQGEAVAGGTYPGRDLQDLRGVDPADLPAEGGRGGRRDHARRPDHAAGDDRDPGADRRARDGRRDRDPRSRRSPRPPVEETPVEPPVEEPRRPRADGDVAPEAEPSGQGRDTCRFPATLNRQGSSAALVIPIRGPATTSSDDQPGGGALDRRRRPRGRSR